MNLFLDLFLKIRHRITSQSTPYQVNLSSAFAFSIAGWPIVIFISFSVVFTTFCMEEARIG